MGADSLEYRPIRPDDLAGIADISRAALPHDPVTESLVEEKIFGDPCFDCDLSLLCADGKRVVAFAPVAVCGSGGSAGPRTAYLILFATDPGYRGHGIMTRLFGTLEIAGGVRGIGRIRVMDHGHNYLTPGVDVRATAAHCFLAKMGYRREGEGINLSADLGRVRFDLEERIRALRERGIEVRRAQPTDLPGLRAFLARHWDAWDHEVSETFRNDPISTHIALSGGEIVGFSSSEGNNRGTGSFGPMGTDPPYRRRGIGEALCLLCLQDLAGAGHRRAVIPWVGPIRFYSRVCGAEIDRVFWRYRKELE